MHTTERKGDSERREDLDSVHRRKTVATFSIFDVSFERHIKWKKLIGGKKTEILIWWENVKENLKLEKQTDWVIRNFDCVSMTKPSKI